MQVQDLLPRSPLSQLLLLAGVSCAIAGLFLWEVLKSADSQRPPSGKKWKLPPGPKGRLLFGNLEEVRGGRESVGPRTKSKNWRPD